mmetsp:Transcript_27931/g.28339  ORF Transcript_27931/g.28339 Transcript_27931/m.28339 type:complete len:84 (-) Transcript_27931:7-258(-)
MFLLRSKVNVQVLHVHLAQTHAGVVTFGFEQFVMQKQKFEEQHLFSSSSMPTLFYRLQMNLIIFKLKHTQSLKKLYVENNPEN